MLNDNIIPGILCLGAGTLILILRFQRWEWFMNHYKVKNIDDVFGTKRADIVYALIGSIFMILGILLITNLI